MLLANLKLSVREHLAHKNVLQTLRSRHGAAVKKIGWLKKKATVVCYLCCYRRAATTVC